jgi:hypothetical protein
MWVYEFYQQTCLKFFAPLEKDPLQIDTQSEQVTKYWAVATSLYRFSDCLKTSKSIATMKAQFS